MARSLPPLKPLYEGLDRTLPQENLSLMQLTPKDIAFLRGADSNIAEKNKINLGDIVVLPNISVEDMSFGGLMFKVVGRIGDHKGVPINSYILKEVLQDENGDFVDAYGISKRNKLTITRNISRILGIEYETGLEIWPDNLNFIRYDAFVGNTPQERELNYSNMGTYPCNSVTGIIDKICVEVSGFVFKNGTRITTPSGVTMPSEIFFNNIEFLLKIDGLNGGQIPFRLISPTEKISRNILYFELGVSKYNLTPIILEGLNIDDVITFKWMDVAEVRKFGIRLLEC